MKTTLKALMITAFLCLFASSAWSLSILDGAIDVGGVDTLLAITSMPNSGDDAEISWAESVISQMFGISDISLDAKYDSGEMAWYQTEQDYTYAFDFTTCNPEFFLIKIGDGNLPNSYDSFLFQNTPELAWGVVSLAGFGVGQIIGLDRISHVDEFNGGEAPVPEPATLLLLGSGLLGLAGFRKKLNG